MKALLVRGLVPEAFSRESGERAFLFPLIPDIFHRESRLSFLRIDTRLKPRV